MFPVKWFMRNCSPRVGEEEEEDSAVPDVELDDLGFGISSFEELTAPVLKMLPAGGALDVLLLLLEAPNPEKPVLLANILLDASLLAPPPKLLPVELSFEVRLLAEEKLDPNMPPPVLASETSPSEDSVFEPNRPRGGALDVSLLGDMPLEPNKLSAVDEGGVVLIPKADLLEGVWVFALLPKAAEFDPNRLPPGPGDSVCF